MRLQLYQSKEIDGDVHPYNYNGNYNQNIARQIILAQLIIKICPAKLYKKPPKYSAYIYKK